MKPNQPSGLVYLAQPYSHTDATIRTARFEAGMHAAAVLMREGMLVFSPIAHSHPIAEKHDLPGDFAFWQAFDEAVIAGCSELLVLMLDGWRESVGVRAEIEIALHRGLPIRMLRPLGDGEYRFEVYADWIEA